MKHHFGLLMIAFIAFDASWATAAEMGTAFTYQGYLKNTAGPVTDTCDFRIGLWNAFENGSQVGNSPQIVTAVPVTGGLFTLGLVDGTALNFGAAAIDGTARWLEIEVCCPSPCAPVLLGPRVSVSPAPHALALPGLYTQQNAQSSNLIGGYAGNFVAPGVFGATISGGGGSGELNQVTSIYGAVGGGSGNTTSGLSATIAGGGFNATSGNFAAVGGGVSNGASAHAATVGGGQFNMATNQYGTVGGGRSNVASEQWSTIGGGEANAASGEYSTVAGGTGNTASDDGATVGGGSTNSADGEKSTVSGGTVNTASGVEAAVGGGIGNTASGLRSTVGGGDSNVASGKSSTAPGGISNVAGGDHSFAAGQAAKVRNAAEAGDADGDQGTFVWADSSIPSFFTSTGPNQFLIRATGGVGIGTASPARPLHVLTGGDFAARFETSDTNASVVEFKNSSSSTTWEFAVAGTAPPFGLAAGSMYLLRQGAGAPAISLPLDNRVGIGTPTPAAKLDVVASSMHGIQATTNSDDGVRGLATAGAGAGVAGFATAASVFSAGYFSNTAGGRGLFVGGLSELVRSGATVATFDRGSNDGTVIEIKQAGTTEGTISVTGTTVSYNAFTGSHYAWTDDIIERGMLVVMTGDNRLRHQDPAAEPIYGISTSSTMNDSACLGAYLGLLEPAQPASEENPHQVMAVGNGDMWVVETRRNIAPGDYLISSHVRGHAMLDDAARFPVGHIVARAGEPVDWSRIAESDPTSGLKHRRISVFFESFVRGDAAAAKAVAEQRQQVDQLERRLAEVEAAGARSSLAFLGIVGIGLGGAAIGRGLRRVNNGGTQ